MTPGHQNHVDRLNHIEDAGRLGVIVEPVVDNNGQPDDLMDCEQSQPIVPQGTSTEATDVLQPAGNYPAGLLGSILTEMSQNGLGAPARKSFADAAGTPPPAKQTPSGKKTRNSAKLTTLLGKTSRSEGKAKPSA